MKQEWLYHYTKWGPYIYTKISTDDDKNIGSTFQYMKEIFFFTGLDITYDELNNFIQSAKNNKFNIEIVDLKIFKEYVKQSTDILFKSGVYHLMGEDLN